MFWEKETSAEKYTLRGRKTKTAESIFPQDSFIIKVVKVKMRLCGEEIVNTDCFAALAMTGHRSEMDGAFLVITRLTPRWIV